MRIIIIGLMMMMIIPTVQGATIELLENTDRCNYNEQLDLDHCFSKYLICEDGIKESYISFVYREPSKSYLDIDNFGSKLDTEIEIEKKDECLEIAVTGWKNKFIDVDNVPCLIDECFYQYIWWNSSMTRWFLNKTDSNNNSNIVLVNDSYGVNIDNQIYYIWTENTSTYLYNNSQGKLFTTDNNVQTGSFCDECYVDSNYGLTDVSLTHFIGLNCTGSHCEDMTRYNHDATLINSPVEVDAKIGVGQKCSAGSSQYVDINFSTPTTTFSYCVWITFSGVTGDMGVFTYVSASDWTQLYRAGNTNGRIDYGEFDGGYTGVLSSGVGISYDGVTPTFVCLTSSGINRYLYLNGVLNASGTSSRFGTYDEVCSGALCYGAGGMLNGTLDNIMIWNRTLFADEIEALYNNTLPEASRYLLIGEMEDTGYVPPIIPPVVVPIQIHSFIVYKIVSVNNPILNWILEQWTFKSIIMFMDRLTIQNNLVVGGNITGNQIRGEMWYHNHTPTTLNFVADGVYYNLTFSDSLVNGFTFNNTGDYLEPQYTGIYQANYIASGSGQNNHVYYTDITVNGEVINKCESHKKMTAGGDITTMAGTCHIELSSGDKIRLATADIGGTGNGAYYSSNLNLVRIGD